MRKEEVVKLVKYATLEEAQVVSVMLDSMGIENQIMNETAVQVMPYLGPDIYIVVNSTDYEKAKEILDAKIVGK